MARLLPVPSPGHIARVRQRLYLVDDVVAPPMAGESTLVRLSCVDDDAQGQPLEVLWEREIDPAILTGEAWDVDCQAGVRPAEALRRLPAHPPLELRHGDRPALVPVAVPRWHPARCLPA